MIIKSFNKYDNQFKIFFEINELNVVADRKQILRKRKGNIDMVLVFILKTFYKSCCLLLNIVIAKVYFFLTQMLTLFNRLQESM